MKKKLAIGLIAFFILLLHQTFGFSVQNCNNGVGGGGSNNLTCNLTSTSSGDEVVIFVGGLGIPGFNQTSNTLGLTDGASLTAGCIRGWDSGASPNIYETVYYGTVITSEATDTVTAHLSSSVDYWGISAYDIGPSGGIVTNSGTGCASGGTTGYGYFSDSFAGGTYTNTLTTVNNGILLGDLNCTNGCAATTAGSGYSGVTVTNTSQFTEYQVFGSGTSQTVTFGQANSSTKLGGVAVAFEPQAAATSGIPQILDILAAPLLHYGIWGFRQ